MSLKHHRQVRSSNSREFEWNFPRPGFGLRQTRGTILQTVLSVVHRSLTHEAHAVKVVELKIEMISHKLSDTGLHVLHILLNI